MDNKNRSGFVTSSQAYRIVASLKSGKPSQAFFGYIDEIVAERAMGRVCDVQVKTQPMKWGSLMEVVLFNLLGMEFEMSHKKTIKHHKYSKIWSGTPDLIAELIKIGEIKCFQPKNFALLSLCILKKNIELFKIEFPKEYWQCVSNAMLCKVKKAEIIAYMPYKKELKEIIQQIDETNFLERNNLDPYDYAFMSNDIESLPYLPDDSKMSNINSFEFEIPMEDKMLLTKRIIEAEKLVELKFAS